MIRWVIDSWHKIHKGGQTQYYRVNTLFAPVTSGELLDFASISISPKSDGDISVDPLSVGTLSVIIVNNGSVEISDFD